MDGPLDYVAAVPVVQVRGVDISYEVSGAGPWLVWGHGLVGSMEREDTFSVVDQTVLASGRRLLRYDARGHGSSGSTASPEAYHWRELARDQLALADALGLDTYLAGGASMGCATAVHAALLAPGRITGLLLAIPPTAWDTRAAQQGAYEASAQLIDDGEIDQLVAGIRSAPSPEPLIDVAEWRDASELTFRSTDSERLARIFRGAAVADFPSRDAIATLAVPTMILAWTGDPAHPVSTARELHDLMPHAELHLASSLDELTGWTELVEDFLARCP